MDHFNKKEQAFKNILSDLDLDLDLDLDMVWQDVEGQLTFKDEDRLPFFIRILSGLVLLSASFLFIGSFFIQSENLLVEQVSENNNSTYTSQSLVTTTTTTTTTSSNAIISENVLDKDDKEIIRESEVIDLVEESVPTVSKPYFNVSETLFSAIPSSTSSEETIAQVQSTIPSVYDIKNVEVPNTRLQTLLDPNKLPLRPVQGSLFAVAERSMNLGELSFVKPQTINPVEKLKWMPYYSMNLGSDLSVNGIEIHDTELRNRDNKANYENGLPGFSGSLLAGLENESGFKIYGGVSLSQAITRYRDVDFSKTSETTIGTTSFRIDENGNENPIEGPLNNNAVTQYDVNWHRMHTSFDILLGAGKNMNLGKGFHFDLSGGINFNFFTRSSGYIFQDDLETITKFSNEDNDHYRTSWGLGAHTRVGIEKEISQVLSLGLHGVGTHYFNPINSETQFFNLKNSRIGLQFGITYRPIRESH